jgi:hypothetical protein
VDIDGLYSGPLSSYVSFEGGRAASKLHGEVFSILMAAVVLHVIAVAFYYLFNRQDLISPMITGRQLGGAGPEGELQTAPHWRLAVGMVLASAGVWLIHTGFNF